MTGPRLDRVLVHAGSPFAAVLLAAKRARHLTDQRAGAIEYPPPLVDTTSHNAVNVALEELAAGKIKRRRDP